MLKLRCIVIILLTGNISNALAGIHGDNSLMGKKSNDNPQKIWWGDGAAATGSQNPRGELKEEGLRHGENNNVASVSYGIVYLPVLFCLFFCLTPLLVTNSHAATPYYVEAGIWLGLGGLASIISLIDAPKNFLSADALRIFLFFADAAALAATQGYFNQEYLISHSASDKDLFLGNMVLDILLTFLFLIPALRYSQILGPSRPSRKAAMMQFYVMQTIDRTEFRLLHRF
jgi:hypothetical protein